jgi:hypothetical protein
MAAIAGRRLMSGMGVGFGSYDLMRGRTERKMTMKFDENQLASMSREDVVKNMETMEAHSLTGGKRVTANESYQALKRRYVEQLKESREATQLSALGRDKALAAEAQERESGAGATEALRKAKRKKNIQKGAAAAAGLVVGTGLFAKAFGWVREHLGPAPEAPGVAPKTGAVEALPERMPSDAEKAIAELKVDPNGSLEFHGKAGRGLIEHARHLPKHHDFRLAQGAGVEGIKPLEVRPTGVPTELETAHVKISSYYEATGSQRQPFELGHVSMEFKPLSAAELRAAGSALIRENTNGHLGLGSIRGNNELVRKIFMDRTGQLTSLKEGYESAISNGQWDVARRLHGGFNAVAREANAKIADVPVFKELPPINIPGV